MTTAILIGQARSLTSKYSPNVLLRTDFTHAPSLPVNFLPISNPKEKPRDDNKNNKQAVGNGREAAHPGVLGKKPAVSCMVGNYAQQAAFPSGAQAVRFKGEVGSRCEGWSDIVQPTGTTHVSLTLSWYHCKGKKTPDLTPTPSGV